MIVFGDARALAQQVRERIRDRAEAKDVDVVLHCTCRGVWAQPQAFPEALYELVNNAVQATRRGYPVIVDARDTREGDVLWQIQDAGEGMSAQALADLGRPPHHGVALAWSVIDNHGGSLRFESAPGVGTTASVWLPGRPAALPNDELPHPRPRGEWFSRIPGSPGAGS